VSVACPPLGTYFNVYHRNDVVAYRIEPLLLPPGAAARPAAYVPYSGGADGQRLHVKVKQTVRSVQKAVTGIGAAAASSASAVGSWFNSSLSEKVLAATAALDAAARPRSAAADGSADAEGGSDGAGGAADQATREYALNGGEPVDWVLQETELEAANEYLSAAQAHTGYFDNPDVAAFMLRHVVARQASHTARTRRPPLPAHVSTPHLSGSRRRSATWYTESRRRAQRERGGLHGSTALGRSVPGPIANLCACVCVRVCARVCVSVVCVSQSVCVNSVCVCVCVSRVS